MLERCGSSFCAPVASACSGGSAGLANIGIPNGAMCAYCLGMSDDAELPLLFHAPPTWPVPSAEWIGGHQAWQPPPGWVPPVLGAVPAPIGWMFWSENPVGWPRYARPRLSAARRSMGWGCATFALGVLMAAFGAASGIGPLAVFWVAVGIGAIVMIGALVDLRRIRADMLEELHDNARELRESTERDQYQDYLRWFRSNR